MLLKILLWGIVIYYLYKFVFGVVVPVSKTAGEMKQKMNEMQKAQEQFLKQQKQQQEQFQQQQQTAQDNLKPKKGDYIEFEEIKN
jgi:Sec-independent protein translocase protein TatA